MSTNHEIFQDTPEHQAGMTSSIGGLWPPEKASFNRIKAIDTRGVVTSPQQIGDINMNFVDSCIHL